MAENADAPDISAPAEASTGSPALPLPATAQMNSYIILGLISIPVVYLLWMLSSYFFSDDYGLIDLWPWRLITFLAADTDKGSNPIVYLGALVYLVITSITANDEKRVVFLISLALVLTGAILSVGMLFTSLGGWSVIGSSSLRYETELGGENSALFDADMKFFFGNLSIWYILLLGARMGIRAKDIKGAAEEWIKNYLRKWVGS